MGFLKKRANVNSENMWEGSDPIDIFSRWRFGLPTLPFYDPQNPNTSIYINVAAYNVMQRNKLFGSPRAVPYLVKTIRFYKY